MSDYYRILEVPITASDEEIKKSYRKLAMKWHPDRNANSKDAEEKFKEIKEAYETLSDPYKRKQYDASQESVYNQFHSHSSSKKSHFDPFSNSNFEHGFQDFFNDRFNDIFGGHSSAIAANIHINFWESVFGCKKTFEIIFLNSKNHHEKKLISVTLPSGVNDNETFMVDVDGLRIQLTINIEPDPKFHKNNLDILVEIDIPFSMAILGGKMTLPHWDGDIQVNIPPGTQNKQSILLANKGIKKDMFIGDFYIICNITVPKKLTPKQKAILEEFRLTEKEPTSFFENVKNNWKSFFKA